jgi:hypothetical protein
MLSGEAFVVPGNATPGSEPNFRSILQWFTAIFTRQSDLFLI